MFEPKNAILRLKGGLISFFLLFGLVLLCSHFSLTLLYGITFSFTSISLFLILRLYGLSWAILSWILSLVLIPKQFSSLADSAILLMELLFVGLFFVNGRKAKMFFVDVFFWLTLGAVAVFFLNRLTTSGDLLYFLVCKDLINGSFNVLIVDMLLAYFPFYKFIKHINKNSVSIHQFLSHITILSIFVPFFLIIMPYLWNSKELLTKDQLFTNLLSQLKFLPFFALCLVILVNIVSRIFMKNLNQLTCVTTGLPEKLIKFETIEWPQSYVSELRLLSQNLKVMAAKLKELFQESIEMNQKLTEQTEQLRDSEDKLHHLAYYDSLTELPNRLHFRRFTSELIEAKASEMIAIIFIDVNQFKQINDTLGHDAGDTLLQLTANKLRKLRTANREIFRLGGDEFVIVDSVKTREEVNETLNHMIKEFSASIPILGQTIYVTLSAGISMYPEDGNDLDTLVKFADIAMYTSKESGGTTAKFFDESMRGKFQQRLLIENGLREAVEHGKFELFYQPKVQAGRVKSMEVLLRWNDPRLGYVSPATFIPIAEEIGLIFTIDEFALTQACIQNKKWHDQGFLRVPIAVNISAKHFQGNDLVLVVQKALDLSGLEPKYLKIEITESVFIKNSKFVEDVIYQLKNLGVLISIDDFGKGYSCLEHLLQLPFDELKIDREFIKEIDQNKKKQLLVKSLLDIAHGLRLNVVAEGVETEKEKNILEYMGCDELQGYLFSPPVNNRKIEKFLIMEHGGALNHEKYVQI